MAQGDVKRAAIASKQQFESTFGPLVKAAMLCSLLAAHEARAHHRRECQRHDGGNQDRRRHGDGEFAEKAADNPAHQEQRDEDGYEREADRQNRESDLARALERRLHRAQPVLDVPVDILLHDDRVIDDETDGDGKRHQREIVETIAEHIHDGEGTDERQSEEHEDHHHDEGDGQHQRELDVGDGGADRLSTIAQHFDLDCGRDRFLEFRKRGFDEIDRSDDIGARQFEDCQQDRRLAVCPCSKLVVLRCIDGAADVADANGGTIAIGHDDVVPRSRLEFLVVVVDGEAPSRSVD